MQFTLFIVANALLFIRPSELIAELNAVEIYRWFILACFAISLPAVLKEVTQRYPGVPPIVTCVVLLLPAILASGFYHGNFDLIQDTVAEFVKILVYFLLLVALITDVSRLRQFLRWIGVFSAAVTLIAVVRYHSDASAPPVRPNPENKKVIHGTFVVDEVRDPATGELVKVNRMCGTGIFNDPNDFALILVTAVPLCLCWLSDPSVRGSRPLWLMLMLFFGYALMLTASRGGFLALIAGLATLFYLKYGSKKTILLGAICVPVMLAVFAGRMTSFSTDEGTGQTRIQLWSDGLDIFRNSPLIGIGMENYRQFSRHVAHQSFIHCFTELGILGGAMFLGAFYFAVRGLFALRNRMEEIDPELRRLYPYVTAMLVSYTVGICFLSRSYIVPTYMMLGLAVVYMRLHSGQALAPVPAWTFAWPRLAGVTCTFLVGAFLFVRLFVNWRS